MYAQLSLLVTVLLCIGSNPGVLWSHTGLSFYGNFQNTLFPYVLGLGLAAFSLSRAADYIAANSQMARMLRVGLKVSGLALAGIVLSPTLVSSWSAVAHVLFAVILFAAQAAVGVRLALRLPKNTFNGVLLCVQVLGLAGIVLSFRRVGALSGMLPSQIIELFAFTALALRAVLAWERARAVHQRVGEKY